MPSSAVELEQRENDRARLRGHDRRASGARRPERGIVPQDRRLELAKPRARLDTELVDERLHAQPDRPRAPRPGGRSRRAPSSAAPAGAPAKDSPARAPALPGCSRRSARTKSSASTCRSRARARSSSSLAARGWTPDLLREIGERRAAPERRGPRRVAGRRSRPAPRRGRGCRREPAARTRGDRAYDFRDEGCNRCPGSRSRPCPALSGAERRTPERDSTAVGGGSSPHSSSTSLNAGTTAVRLRQQYGEHGSLAWAPEFHRPSGDGHLERPEQPVLDHVHPDERTTQRPGFRDRPLPSRGRPRRRTTALRPSTVA